MQEIHEVAYLISTEKYLILEFDSLELLAQLSEVSGSCFVFNIGFEASIIEA